MRLTIITAGLVFCAACTTTTFSPTPNARSHTPNSGKVIVLTNEAGKQNVPGAEEIGTIRVETTSPWISNAGFLRRWKKEAARRGANAIKWYGAGCYTGFRWPKYYKLAKAYRVPNIDDPAIVDYMAQSWAEFHD